MNPPTRCSPGGLTAYLLLCALMVCGCASAWPTPTPLTVTPAPTATAILGGPRSTPVALRSTPTPPATLAATPATRPVSLTLTDAAVQSWTDPNDIRGVLLDGPYLWAVTGGGVVRWERTSGQYRLYTMQDGLPGQAARGLAQDGDGHIWVGFEDHESWCEYDGQQWHAYPTREDAVAARYEALRQAKRFDARMWACRADSPWVWLTTLDGRVKGYNGQKWLSAGEREGVTRNTTLVAVSRDGRVWAVGEGVSTAEEGDRWWDDHSLFAGVPEGSVAVDLAVDREGGAWLAFVGPARLGGGLGRLDFSQNRWTGHRYTLNSAIPRQVHRVEFDTDGAQWICGDGGVTFHAEGRWQQVPAGDLVVQNFAHDRVEGRFWLGTARGVWSVAADGSDLHGPWLIPSPLVGNDVHGLALDAERRLWIGTEEGVSSVSPSGEVAVLTTEEALCLVAGPDGRIWAGTRGGLFIVQGADRRELVLAKAVRIIRFGVDGKPWVCTEDGELFVREGTAWRSVAHAVELTGGLPRDLAVGSEGNLWLATAAGLGLRDPQGAYSRTTREDNLPSDDVRALALGPEGELWIATVRGLARRQPDGRLNRLTVQSTEGGLRSADTQALLMDATGTLWIATAAGLSMRTPEADWSYLDLPGIRFICPEPGGAIWLGTRSGLYRARRDALTRVP